MKVVLMRGRIGSGKSFRAAELSGQTGALVLSMDDAMEAVYGTECLGREKHLAAEKGILNYFLTLCTQLYKKGQAVIIDHGFWTAEELSTAVSYLEERGIPYVVETMEADFETRLSRVENRENGKRFDGAKLSYLDGFYEE